jgi:hypothetical protein
MSGRSDQGITETLARALELTEEALSQVTRMAIEEIRDGLETSNHVDAAERDMRSALRQLVLAERELQTRSALRKNVGQQASASTDGGQGATLKQSA